MIILLTFWAFEAFFATITIIRISTSSAFWISIDRSPTVASWVTFSVLLSGVMISVTWIPTVSRVSTSVIWRAAIGTMLITIPSRVPISSSPIWVIIVTATFVRVPWIWEKTTELSNSCTRQEYNSKAIQRQFKDYRGYDLGNLRIKGIWQYMFCLAFDKNLWSNCNSVVKFWQHALFIKYWRANDIIHPPSCFITRSILKTSQQGRLYKTYCQLVKPQGNWTLRNLRKK